MFRKIIFLDCPIGYHCGGGGKSPTMNAPFNYGAPGSAGPRPVQSATQWRKLLEGGCHCGRIRYRVGGEPIAKTLCHCRSCRRASGGVTVAWAIFENDEFERLSGDLSWYSSSPGIHWGFCGNCGSLLVYRRDSRPDHTDLTTASLDEPDGFAPTVEIWTDEKISWERLNDALPHKPRSSLNE